MFHVPDTTAKTLFPEIQVSVDKNATMITDAATHYANLKSVVKEHIPLKVKDKKADVLLPWVHKSISNAKRNLLGIHHSINEKYAQNYLNEFCFKFNRRYDGLDIFDRLINVAVQYRWNDSKKAKRA